MADEKVPELTDEAIDNIVKVVEAGEVMAKVMGTSVSKAVYFMMKSSQAMSRLKNQGIDISSLPIATKRKQ